MTTTMTTESVETVSEQEEQAPPPPTPQPKTKFDDGDPVDFDDDEDDDGDDGDGRDRPGFLVTFRDGRQPEVIHCVDLDGDVHEQVNEVLKRFDQADKNGHSHFKIGLQRLRMADIRRFGWSEEVSLPEFERFDSLQDRVEGLMDAMDDMSRFQRRVLEHFAQLTDQQGQLTGAIAQAYQAEAHLAQQEARDMAPAVLAVPSAQPAEGDAAPAAPAAPATAPRGKLKLPGME